MLISRKPSVALGRLVLVLQVTLLLPVAAAARTVVTGQNDPAVDVAAVQAAVDGGGRVRLVGTFDFGDTGRVLLRNDVDIRGQADDAGNPVTTILGGDWPFYSPLPTVMPPTTVGPNVSIKYIHFDGAKGIAVHLAYTGGASIKHNVVTGMRGRVFNVVGGMNNYRRSCFFIGPFDSRPRTTIEITPLLVTGLIDLSNNYCDASGVESATQTNAGLVFMAFLYGAEVQVENNISLGCTRNCVTVVDNLIDPTGQGSVVIADNSIISDVPVGFTGPGPRAPIGIDAGYNFNAAIGTDPNRPHPPTLIRDNYIKLSGRNSMGIISGYNGAAVVGNSVHVHADPSVTTGDPRTTTGGILCATSHQVILHNRIKGEGWNAIRVGGNTVGLPRIDNFVKGNKICQFDAFSSDYLLDVASQFNTLIGKGGTVVDNGTDNEIILRPAKEHDCDDDDDIHRNHRGYR